jgi:hypothetical protein
MTNKDQFGFFENSGIKEQNNDRKKSSNAFFNPNSTATNKEGNGRQDSLKLNFGNSSNKKETNSSLNLWGYLASVFPSLNNNMFMRESKNKENQPDFDFNPKSDGKKGMILSSTNSKKGEVVSVTYEEIGLWPRSFSRVLDRFLKQVFSDVENLVIQEYRFYRYLFLTTVRCLCILVFVPFLVNFFLKNYLIHPLTEYFWNSKQSEIFLNSYQQKHAFSELKEFEEKLYFESFLSSNTSLGFSKNLSEKSPILMEKTEVNTLDFSKKESSGLSTQNQLIQLVSSEIKDEGNVQLKKNDQVMPDIDTNRQRERNLNKSNFQPVSVQENKQTNQQLYRIADSSLWEASQRGLVVNKLSSPYNPESTLYKQKLQEKTVEIATRYNEESIEAISNFFADFFSFLTLFYLLFYLEIQLNITKSFLLEVFFGLDDSKKSLLILLVTDLLVGYHSSNIWELFFSFIFHHYGLPESQTGIFLLVATLPVLLDVLFKYLIFRHLNRSSPATVATYHAMIE